jgi:hypothetical protein
MDDKYIPLVAFGSFAALIGLAILGSRPAYAAQIRLTNAMADGIEQGKITHISSPMVMGMGMGMQQRVNPRKKKSKHRKNPAVTPILF